MLDLKTVLLASDGSPGALHAARWLRSRLKGPPLLRLIILSIQPPIPQGWPDIDTRQDDVDKLWEERLRLTLDLFSDFDPPPGRLLRGGEASEGILAAIREFTPDLVVLGSRGHSPLGGALLGSVSLAVAGRSPVPVLIVPDPGS